MIKTVAHPDFAQRMQTACDGNPDVPLPNYGRLGWFAERVTNTRGENVTVETVRKWFAGETLPRRTQMAQLAQALRVSPAWLALGESPELTEKEQKVRNALADGAVNVVAGFISMCGGHPAFPAANDQRAKKNKIDICAVIKGAQYAFTVVVGLQKDDGVHFAVPVESIHETLVLGVVRTSDLAVDIYELDLLGLETQGKRKASALDVRLDADHKWRERYTFADRR